MEGPPIDPSSDNGELRIMEEEEWEELEELEQVFSTPKPFGIPVPLDIENGKNSRVLESSESIPVGEKRKILREDPHDTKRSKTGKTRKAKKGDPRYARELSEGTREERAERIKKAAWSLKWEGSLGLALEPGEGDRVSPEEFMRLYDLAPPYEEEKWYLYKEGLRAMLKRNGEFQNKILMWSVDSGLLRCEALVKNFQRVLIPVFGSRTDPTYAIRKLCVGIRNGELRDLQHQAFNNPDRTLVLLTAMIKSWEGVRSQCDQDLTVVRALSYDPEKRKHITPFLKVAISRFTPECFGRILNGMDRECVETCLQTLVCRMCRSWSYVRYREFLQRHPHTPSLPITMLICAMNGGNMVFVREFLMTHRNAPIVGEMQLRLPYRHARSLIKLWFEFRRMCPPDGLRRTIQLQSLELLDLFPRPLITPTTTHILHEAFDTALRSGWMPGIRYFLQGGLIPTPKQWQRHSMLLKGPGLTPVLSIKKSPNIKTSMNYLLSVIQVRASRSKFLQSLIPRQGPKYWLRAYTAVAQLCALEAIGLLVNSLLNSLQITILTESHQIMARLSPTVRSYLEALDQGHGLKPDVLCPLITALCPRFQEIVTVLCPNPQWVFTTIPPSALDCICYRFEKSLLPVFGSCGFPLYHSRNSQCYIITNHLLLNGSTLLVPLTHLIRDTSESQGTSCQ